MPNINQVMKSLHCCSLTFDHKCECCLYHGIVDCESKLKRDAEELLNRTRPDCSRNTQYIVRWTDGAFQFMPDVMQELILCKDCKHGCICKDETGQDVVECFKLYKTRKLDWYCADGEAR